MLLRGPIETMRNPMAGTVKIRGTAPGFFFRAKARNNRLNDTRSQAVGRLAAFMANQWKLSLTSSQRTAWDTYAAANPAKKHSGRTVLLNGWQAFNRINRSRLTALNLLLVPLPPLPLLVRKDPPPSGIPEQAPLNSWDILLPGIASYLFDNTAPWTKDIRVAAVVCTSGPAAPGVQKTKNFGRVVAAHIGIPIIGHPLTYTQARPFPSSMSAGAIFTYLAYVEPFTI